MISAEAPVLFAKAAQIFITELTLRAWIHTEDNKRRTLQVRHANGDELTTYPLCSPFMTHGAPPSDQASVEETNSSGNFLLFSFLLSFYWDC